jgi:hypothetical protein
MEKFSVTMSISGEYLTTVRLTVGGLCALVGADVDTAEDYKVCVTESLLLLKRSGYTQAELVFGVGEKLTFTVTGLTATGETEESIEDEISKALLSALLCEIRFIEEEHGKLTKIAFEG